MTLLEELLSLDVDSATKDRLIVKLKREYIERNEVEAIVAKEHEQWYRQTSCDNDVNVALADACLGLAKVAQLKLKERY